MVQAGKTYIPSELIDPLYHKASFYHDTEKNQHASWFIHRLTLQVFIPSTDYYQIVLWAQDLRIWVLVCIGRTLEPTFIVPLPCRCTLLTKQTCVEFIKTSDYVLPCVCTVVSIVIAILLCKGLNDQEPHIFLQLSACPVNPIMWLIVWVSLYVGSCICLLCGCKTLKDTITYCIANSTWCPMSAQSSPNCHESNLL